MLYTVPRCSGGLTSASRANQFGELAEVSASATNAETNASATVGSVTMLRSTATTVCPVFAFAATSTFNGTKNSTT